MRTCDANMQTFLERKGTSNHKKIDIQCQKFLMRQHYTNWLTTVCYRLGFLPEWPLGFFMKSHHTPYHALVTTTCFFTYQIKGKKRGFIMSLLSLRILWFHDKLVYNVTAECGKAQGIIWLMLIFLKTQRAVFTEKWLEFYLKI